MFGEESLSVKADANQTVTANFVEQFKLTANVTVPAGTPAAARPTVSLLPASADGFYNAGSVVRLTPNLSPTLRFNSWTGDATGSANPLTLTMTGAKTVTAAYAAAGTATPGPAPGN